MPQISINFTNLTLNEKSKPQKIIYNMIDILLLTMTNSKSILLRNTCSCNKL